MPRASTSASCPICSDPRAADINAALGHGDGLSDVSRSFGLGDPPSKDLWLHAERHLTSEVSKARTEAIKHGRRDLSRAPTPGRVKAPAGTRRARVEHIAQMIARGQYVTGDTAHELAKIWNLQSFNYIEHLAGEARRLLDARLDKSRDSLIAEAMVTLQTARRIAIEEGKPGDAVKAALAILGVADKYYTSMTSPVDTPAHLIPNVVNIHYADGVAPLGHPAQPTAEPSSPGTPPRP